VALAFYDRLGELYRKPNGTAFPEGVYPKAWSDVNPSHHAMANLGQLKNAFMFDLHRDRDGGHMTDLAELRWNAANPGAPDFLNPFADGTDGDDLPDAWEMLYFAGLNRDGTLDFDGDGLSEMEEFLFGANPTLVHTDADGFSDREEFLLGTDPAQAGDTSAASATGLSVYVP
jgi:hypothetical protein